MKWITSGLLMGSLLLASPLSAQQQPPQQQPPQQQPPQQQPPQQQPPQQQLPRQMQPQAVQPQQDVVATVNSEPVTRIELEAKVQEQAQGQQGVPQSSEQRQKQALDALIQSRLIEQYVVDKGPDVESEEIETIIARVKQQLAEQNVDFRQFLAAQGHTEESFKKRIEGSIAWQKYQQQQMTEDKLQKFFEDNKNLFQAERFEEAQQEVARAYAMALWQDIVRQMQPEAEIKIIESTRMPGAEGQPSPLPVPNGGR